MRTLAALTLCVLVAVAVGSPAMDRAVQLLDMLLKEAVDNKASMLRYAYRATANKDHVFVYPQKWNECNNPDAENCNFDIRLYNETGAQVGHERHNGYTGEVSDAIPVSGVKSNTTYAVQTCRVNESDDIVKSQCTCHQCYTQYKLDDEGKLANSTCTQTSGSYKPPSALSVKTRDCKAQGNGNQDSGEDNGEEDNNALGN